MVKEITQEETFPLRSAVLRNGAGYDKCVLPTDGAKGIFHLGLYIDEKLVCIGTFFPEDYPDKAAQGMRLRGMATDPAFAGKGFGAELINFAINNLSAANAAYIWCNARAAAVGFYRKLGFGIISEEFDIPGIGPHFDMLLLLKK